MIKKNITFKLTLGFLIIVIISTLFIGIIAMNVFKNNIYEIKRNNMKTHALAISETIEPYMTSGEKDKEFIRIINLLNSIDNAKIWILNSDKSIINASDNNLDSINYIDNNQVKEAYKELNENALRGIDQYLEIYNPYYKEDMMTIAVPIKNNEKIMGAVILNSSTVDLSNSMDKFFLYLILTLIGEILLVGFMGYHFSKNISKPIRKINEAALELTRGHYGIKTNIYQKDEVGELSNSFDLLSLKLEYTIGKLFEEKNKLSNIITSMSEGILALDTNFKIININEAAKNLLLSNGSKHKLETNTEAYEGIIQVLEKLNIKTEFNSVISNSEKKTILKEHSNKVLEFSIASIKSNLNEIIGAVILIQDISEKEKLEQMRKDFISNVSHEFRTPLSIIKGNLESILDGMTTIEDIPNTCTTLINETDRLERMVKDLLNLSRLEAGKLEVNFQELDVNSIIKDTLRGLRPLINNKDIKVELFMEELPELLSDYDKLKQLLLIFLDNAIKFSNNKGLLQISTHNDKENINITIKDQGVGIPKGEIEYLGERFYKADKARNSGGTGLGLSIAKRLIKILNGSFSIESEEGKGTTIIISIYRKSK